MIRRTSSFAAALLITFGAAVSAQTADSIRPRGRGGRAALGRGALEGRVGGAPRQQALQREIRQRFNDVVRRQLALNDEQAKRLQQVDVRFQKERSEVNRDERQARQSLRAALEDTNATPDQSKVDDYIGRLVKASRRKADILESEQKELSGFLTPVQRAKFLALREQLNQRVQQLTREGRGGPGSPGGGPPGGPPPER